MMPWLPTAFALAVAAASAAALPAAGACRHVKSARGCLQPTVNFGSVPDISDQIVGGEGTVQPPPVLSPPQSAAPYTGPMVGISTKARAPTVGYYWSIN